MARVTISGFEDVEKMLEKLSNPYEMAEKAVNCRKELERTVPVSF